MSFNGSSGEHMFTVYSAPRGRERMYQLGMKIAQEHLSPADRVIGVIGEAGSGKSMIIKGMFPGLELTNDDEGVNARPLPLLAQDEENRFYSPHTYHMDMRFEMGFSQLHTLVEGVQEAVARGKRVIIEHFDLIYEALHFNADLIVGVGEEVIVTRPNIFGPLPSDVARIVHKSVRTRLMAHTAEDLLEWHMPEKEVMRAQHGDIKNGFLMIFHDSPPDVDLDELEAKVKDDIAAALDVEYVDDRTIRIGGYLQPCTGPRTHVSNTSKIENFHLLKEIIYDHRNQRWLLVGRVNTTDGDNLHHFNDLMLE